MVGGGQRDLLISCQLMIDGHGSKIHVGLEAELQCPHLEMHLVTVVDGVDDDIVEDQLEKQERALESSKGIYDMI